MKTLTEEQKKAIYTPTSVSVTASAGTGKTTVLTERYLYSHQTKNFDLNQLLAFTFTEKATREMKDRILQSDQIRLYDLPFLKISTLHSFCVKILRQFGFNMGLAQDFELLNDDAATLMQNHDLTLFLNEMLQNHHPDFTTSFEYLGYKNLLRVCQSLNSFNLLSVLEVECFVNDLQIERELYHKIINNIKNWQTEKLQNRMANKTITFDDLEILTLKCLTDFPHVAEFLQKQYKEILVDEFQDISPLQYAIIQHLHNPQHNTLFIVGDPKQSIYGFRNADPKIFLQAKKKIENEGGINITLHHTFRTPKIQQSYFNEVFDLLLNENQQNFFTKGEAHFEVPNAGFYFHLENDSIENDEDEDSQAFDLKAKLIELVQNIINQGDSLNDIAILSQTRSHFFDLQETLHAHEYKTVVDLTFDASHTPLLNSILHLFKFLENPLESNALLGFLRHPFFELNLEQLQNIITASDYDRGSTQKFKKLSLFWEKLENWQIIKTQVSVIELTKCILSDLNWIINANEINIFQHFYLILKSWQNQGLCYLKDVSSVLELTTKEGIKIKASELAQDGIKLFTIHGAKGLEFKHVILWPSSKERVETNPFHHDTEHGFIFKAPKENKPLSLEEKLLSFDDYQFFTDDYKRLKREELMRLIYVALTRTQYNLYIFSKQPTKTFLKAFEKNPKNLKAITNYNLILYWLTQRPWAKKLSTYFADAKTKNSPNLNLIDAQVTNTKELNFQTTPTLWTVTELETHIKNPETFESRYLKGVLSSDNHSVSMSYSKKNTFTELSPIQRGNFLHEVLQFYKPSRQNLKEVISQALFNQHLKISFTSAYEYTESIITECQNHPKLWNRLYSGSEEITEKEFNILIGKIILTGKIDRLVKHQNEWHVIDYKTHTIQSAEQLKEISEKYIFQLKCYALAVQKLFSQINVRASLIFTSSQDMVEFEFTASELNEFADFLTRQNF